MIAISAARTSSTTRVLVSSTLVRRAPPDRLVGRAPSGNRPLSSSRGGGGSGVGGGRRPVGDGGGAKNPPHPPPPPPSAFRRIVGAVSERPVQYLSIPCMAAFVGILTNYAGVQMLFYPIEYEGTDWYREDGSPYGILGWQGVVPARTEKMAGRLVEIVTAKLLSLEEAFGRLEPRPLADLLSPAVDDAVRRDCGPWWAAALRPVLPFVLERVVRALQGEIDDVLDLRAVVLSAFVRDKVVLVNLFQKVGRVELDFLVESGFGFGFALGLAQMALWVLRPRAWTLPVAGGLVGYVTNWIAIKLLFEPADPVHVGPIVLQGLFESRQEAVSDEFGAFMEGRVLSSGRLLDALSRDDADGEKFYAFLRRQLPFPIPERVLRAAVEAVRTIAANPEDHPDVHAYVKEQLDIEDTLSRRLKKLSPTDFEDLLHPVFQEDEIILIVVGGILGAAAGLAQTRLGWGGPGATVKAAATIVLSMASSAFLFGLLEQKEMEDLEEEIEVTPIVRPQLRRRNTILRLKDEVDDMESNKWPFYWDTQIR